MVAIVMPNFPRWELACKCGCNLARFAPGFLQALQGLRDAMGEPMHLNSACRCAKHNQDVGGHPRSLHVGDLPHHPTRGCCAVDVRAVKGQDDAYRAKLERLAWERGWSIGDNPRFIHLDLRSQYVGLKQARFAY